MVNKKKQIANLASLYPTPKTYDEIQAQKDAARARWQKRQPRHVALWTSINLSIAVLVLILVITEFWSFMYLGVITGVFGLFLLGLVWFGFVGWQIKRIAEFFNDKGYSAAPFTLGYFMSAVPLLAGAYNLLKPFVATIVIYLILMILNMLLMIFITTVVIAAKRNNKQKMAILVSTMVVSILFAGITAVL